MTEKDQIEAKSEFHLHPATRPGRVSLTVADLDKQIDFYRQVIGLKLHWREDNKAGLGAGGRDFLRLTEVPTARRYQGTTGMYHFAIGIRGRPGCITSPFCFPISGSWLGPLPGYFR
jgi:catechol 2,3-dioxygenase